MNKDNNPAILVTGSTGGVGSVALQILSKSGYTNISAFVRKDHQKEVAMSLGATDVIFANELGNMEKPLNKQTYDFVLDTVGGNDASTLFLHFAYNCSMNMTGNALRFTLLLYNLQLIL